MLVLTSPVVALATSSFKRAEGLVRVDVVAIGHGLVASLNVVQEVWVPSIGFENLETALIWRVSLRRLDSLLLWTSVTLQPTSEDTRTWLASSMCCSFVGCSSGARSSSAAACVLTGTVALTADIVAVTASLPI